MKKRLLLILAFLIISLQLVSAEVIKTDIGGGVTKEDDDVTGTSTLTVKIGTQTHAIKEVYPSGLVRLLGHDIAVPTGARTHVLTLDFQPTEYLPSDIKKLFPKSTNVNILEDWDNASLKFYKVVGGKQLPEPFMEINGNVSLDLPNKKLIITVVEVTEKIVQGRRKQVSKLVKTEIQLLSNNEIKVFHDGKIIKHVLNDGTVKLYDKGKLITKYNAVKLQKLFPPLQYSNDQKSYMYGYYDIRNTKRVAKDKYSGFSGLSNGYLILKYKYGAKKQTSLWVTGDTALDLTNKKLSLKNITGPTVFVYGIAVRPLRPFIKAGKLDVFLLANKDILISTSKGKEVRLALGDFLPDQNYKLVYMKDHIIQCLDKDCKLDYFIRFGKNYRYSLNITGAASMLAPKDQSGLKSWQKYWEDFTLRSWKFNALIKKKKANPRAIRVRLSDDEKEKINKRLANFKKALLNTKFYDINVTDIKDIKITRSSLFLTLYGKPTSDNSSYANVGVGSKNRSKRYNFRIVLFPYLTTADTKGFLIPAFSSKDLFIKSNNAIHFIMFRKKPGPGEIEYYESGRKIFGLQRGSMLLFDGQDKGQLFNTLYGFLNMNSVWLVKGRIVAGLEGTDLEVPIVLNFYSLLPKYKSIELEKFNNTGLPNKTGSSVSIIGTQNRRMTIKPDKVVLTPGSRWYDFGISFKTYIWNIPRNLFVLLECKVNEQKCYYNRRAITWKPKPKLKRCSAASPCSSNQKCIRGICIDKAKCTKMNLPGMNGPVRLVFVNSQFVAKDKFKNVVEEIIGIKEGGGAPTTQHLGNRKAIERIFNKQPFKGKKDKFSIYYIDEANLPFSEHGGAPYKLTKLFANKHCPGANYPIVMQGTRFGSYAWVEEKEALSFAVPAGTAYISAIHLDKSLNVITHELAHSVFRVSDEYYYLYLKKNSAILDFLRYFKKPFNTWNCAVDVADAKNKGWTAAEINHAKQFRGCGGGCPAVGVPCSRWMKHSKDSIMSKGDYFDSFNKFTEDGIAKRIDQLAVAYGRRP